MRRKDRLNLIGKADKLISLITEMENSFFSAFTVYNVNEVNADHFVKLFQLHRDTFKERYIKAGGDPNHVFEQVKFPESSEDLGLYYFFQIKTGFYFNNFLKSDFLGDDKEFDERANLVEYFSNDIDKILENLNEIKGLLLKIKEIIKNL